MDLPAEVQIHNELLSLKGAKATLVAVSPHGFYEINLTFKGSSNIHRVFLPVQATAVIFREPEPQYEAGIEIER